MIRLHFLAPAGLHGLKHGAVLAVDRHDARSGALGKLRSPAGRRRPWSLCWPGPRSCRPRPPPKCRAARRCRRSPPRRCRPPGRWRSSPEPSGPTSSSTPCGKPDQSCARGRRGIGGHDPAGAARCCACSTSRSRLPVGRQRHAPQRAPRSGDHLQRVAADAAGRAEHGHVGNFLGHKCRSHRESSAGVAVVRPRSARPRRAGDASVEQSRPNRRQRPECCDRANAQRCSRPTVVAVLSTHSKAKRLRPQPDSIHAGPRAAASARCNVTARDELVVALAMYAHAMDRRALRPRRGPRERPLPADAAGRLSRACPSDLPANRPQPTHHRPGETPLDEKRQRPVPQVRRQEALADQQQRRLGPDRPGRGDAAGRVLHAEPAPTRSIRYSDLLELIKIADDKPKDKNYIEVAREQGREGAHGPLSRIPPTSRSAATRSPARSPARARPDKPARVDRRRFRPT